MSLTLLPQLYDLVMKRAEEEMYDIAAPSLSRRNEAVLLLVHCDDDDIVDNSDVVEKE